jgi:hypothetical protein
MKIDFYATKFHKYNAVTLLKQFILFITSKVAVFLRLSSNFKKCKPRIFLEPAFKGKCKDPKNPFRKKQPQILKRTHGNFLILERNGTNGARFLNFNKMITEKEETVPNVSKYLASILPTFSN